MLDIMKANSHSRPKSTDASCRLCNRILEKTFINLGMSPLCESFLRADQLDEMEPFFNPLHTLVCDECFLVQLKEYVKPEHIFKSMHISRPIPRHGWNTRDAIAK